jgi:predicted transglutaminase-like cysteine proteinase
MLLFAREMSMSALVLMVCSASSLAQPEPTIGAGAPASEAASVESRDRPGALPSSPALTLSRKGYGEEPTIPSPNTGLVRGDLAARWLDLQSRIVREQEMLAACRSDDASCSAAARRFLSIVELGRQREGRARIGEINRAVNLSIKPVSDLTQYGVADFWSAPLATLNLAAGDCEDYAIVKYVALQEIGIAPDDLQLVIVQDMKRNTLHAVVAVRHDKEWLILDNRTLIMVNIIEARYAPLFVLDRQGVWVSGSAAFWRR